MTNTRRAPSPIDVTLGQAGILAGLTILAIYVFVAIMSAPLEMTFLHLVP